MEGISYELAHPEMSRPKFLWDRDGWGQGMVLTYTQSGDQELCLISWGSRELPTLVSTSNHSYNDSSLRNLVKVREGDSKGLRNTPANCNIWT